MIQRMDFERLIELQVKYATCPKCKSNSIKDGKMASLGNRFQRACTCGYSVEVLVTEEGDKEVGEIQEPINLEISFTLENSKQTYIN